MCKCTPNIRTPFCGKPGCEWPKPEKHREPEAETKTPLTERPECPIHGAGRKKNCQHCDQIDAAYFHAKCAALERKTISQDATIARLTIERDKAHDFATKIERGEVNFAGICDKELKRIVNMPLGKTIHETIADAVARVLCERDELKASFDLRQAATQRAVERWRSGYPGRELRRPDHVDLCVWLMERLDEAGQDRAGFLENQNFRYCICFLKKAGEWMRATRLVMDIAPMAAKEAKQWVLELKMPMLCSDALLAEHRRQMEQIDQE